MARARRMSKRRYDPDECPECGVSWIGGPVADPANSESDHYTVNVVLMMDEPKRYRCDVCHAEIPLTIWERGYKPEFLASVLTEEFEPRK
jgi:hypothetical protein